MRFFGLSVTRASIQERQEPTVSAKAVSPVPTRGLWRSVFESFGGAWQQNVEVKLDSVLAYSTVYTCISRISSDVAKLRCKLVQQDEDGIWTEAESSAFSPVLRKPNAFQNRVQFFQHWMMCKLAHGNVYVLKERDNRGVVRALYVLDPTRVKPLVSDSGDVFYELNEDPLSGLTGAVVVPAREIIHDRMNTIYHPLVGTSPIFACGLAATQGLRIQNNSANFFANGARPGGVLLAPGAIGDDTAARLKAYFDDNFSGANAGKTAVLGDGLRYEPMMMSATDAQLIEQLKWSAETVANCFQIPPFMVGAGPVPSNNNVEALTTIYYSQCLQVLLESLELCLDEGLDLPSRYGTEFDLNDLMRMDTATLTKATADAIGAGFLAPNEGRARFDLKPVAGGETPYLQQQNYSLAALDERDKQNPLALPAPAPAEPPAEVDDTERAVAALRMKFAEATYA